MSSHDPKTPRPVLWPVPPIRAEAVPLSDIGEEETTLPGGATVEQKIERLQGSFKAVLGQGRETRKYLEAKIERVREGAELRDLTTQHALKEIREALQRIESRPDVTLAVGHLRELVGQPPGSVNPRDSHVGQLTAQQLADLEANGTGLFRLIGQLAKQDRTIIDSIATKAGSTAGTRSAIVTSVTSTAPVWVPAVWEIASTSAYAAIAVVTAVVGLIVTALRRRIAAVFKKG